jgi:gliding-associated putative ABC transporter substrate-binding component GldG
MSKKKTADRTVRLVAILGSLVLVNILGVSMFGRLDMTRDGQFTLNRASERIVSELSDPVKITAYFTSGLPGEQEATKRYVRDLLDEYYAASGGTIAYEVIDPTAAETEEDKEKKKDIKTDIFGRAVREATSIERELESLGIPPRETRVNEDDRVEVKRYYLGIAIKSGDETEVIPSVERTSNLEYDITSRIRKITRTNAPKLAFVTAGDASMVQNQYRRLHAILGEVYEVSSVDLATATEIPEENDTAIVINGPQPFTEAQAAAIDAYVASGRSVAFLLDAIRPDFSSMEPPAELQHGLGTILAKYGVAVQEGLVLDGECAPITVSQRVGPITLPQQKRYPLIPLPRGLDPDHPLTRGLAQVAFPFVSPLEVKVPEGSEIEAEVLVRSSAASFVHLPPFDINPFKRWREDELEAGGASPIVVTLSGPLSTPAVAPPLAVEEQESDQPIVASNSRVVVVGGSGLASDQFMSPTNEAFLLNLIDWLLLDQDLLAVRSRGLTAAPLGNVNEEGQRQELAAGVRLSVRWANVLGVPLAFIVFGIIRWRLREAKRATVTL